WHGRHTGRALVLRAATCTGIVQSGIRSSERDVRSSGCTGLDLAAAGRSDRTLRQTAGNESADCVRFEDGSRYVDAGWTAGSGRWRVDGGAQPLTGVTTHV